MKKTLWGFNGISQFYASSPHLLLKSECDSICMCYSAVKRHRLRLQNEGDVGNDAAPPFLWPHSWDQKSKQPSQVRNVPLIITGAPGVTTKTSEFIAWADNPNLPHPLPLTAPLGGKSVKVIFFLKTAIAGRAGISLNPWMLYNSGNELWHKISLGWKAEQRHLYSIARWGMQKLSHVLFRLVIYFLHVAMRHLQNRAIMTTESRPNLPGPWKGNLANSDISQS